MRAAVLHCYADYKWTGPSEPILSLCAELRRRGWRPDLACKRAPHAAALGLAERARQAGLTVFDNLEFRGGLHVLSLERDAAALRRLISEGEYAIVHCHSSTDHIVAYRALGGRRRTIPLVRTDHSARIYRRTPVSRLHYGPFMTDHLFVLSDRHAVQAVNALGLSPSSVTSVRGAVDVEEFSPMEPPPGLRERLGFRPGDVVFGVVARVQRHRRFEVLLRAAQSLKNAYPPVRIAVLGRGTHKWEILDRRIRRLGLEGVVVSLGYRTDDYKQVLSAMDAGIMLVPGSDGSCRAALQMAAMGKPLVVAQRGVLPDIVVDGQTGMVIQDTPERLARALLEMAADPRRRAEWGKAARQRMQQYFSIRCQADAVERAYAALLA